MPWTLQDAAPGMFCSLTPAPVLLEACLMKYGEYRKLIREYRGLMEDCTTPESWMDWRSDVFVAGTWRCMRLADSYLPRCSRVLDFGCGMGLPTLVLSAYGHAVTGTDIDIGKRYSEVEDSYKAAWGSLEDEMSDPEMLSRCWEALESHYGIRFLAYDGRHLPFEDEVFEGVVAHAVLEHINPDVRESAVLEMRRVLTKNGLVCIFRTPRPQAYLEKLAKSLGLPVHEETLSEGAILKMMTELGFDCLFSGFTDMLPSFPPRGLRAYNAVSAPMVALDGVLLRTPLKRYAHHVAQVYRKRSEPRVEPAGSHSR